MNIKFTDLADVARGVRAKIAAQNEQYRTFGVRQEYTLDALVAQTTGFHIYGDLVIRPRLSKATDAAKASELLEAIEEVAAIADEFAVDLDDTWLFEAQGVRFHLYVEADEADDESIERALAYCSYVAQSVENRVRPIIEQDYLKFCLGMDWGRAVVLSTGREGDDSLISLGNAANRPAKRLAREDIADGHLVMPMELAEKAACLAEERKEQQGNHWLRVNVGRKKFAKLAEEQLRKLEALATTTRVVTAARERVINFGRYLAESSNTDGATVEQPLVVQGLVLRADLHGFTKRIEEAYDRGEAAVEEVVSEFLQILKLPEAFEEELGNPCVRLPWAGDCYNVVIQPRDGEDYDAIREALPAVAAWLWHDPDGQVNGNRNAELRRIAKRLKWSVGIAGGTDCEGRVLLANIFTTARKFLVAAGWGVTVSMEAQNARALVETESALHLHDQEVLRDAFQRAFQPWSESPPAMRKATLKRLSDAYEEVKKEDAPPVPNILIPAKPYYRG